MVFPASPFVSSTALKLDLNSPAELVINQIIQGFGGGIAAITTAVGAQASVPHRDVAIVTAIVLLVTEIGGVVGNAISGAIWS